MLSIKSRLLARRRSANEDDANRNNFRKCVILIEVFMEQSTSLMVQSSNLQKTTIPSNF